MMCLANTRVQALILCVLRLCDICAKVLTDFLLRRYLNTFYSIVSLLYSCMKYSALFIAPIIAAAAFFGFSGCTTLEQGLPQDVVVMSFPSEASIYVNGEARGITPMTLQLPRKLVHEIRLEKQGYNPAVKYFTPVPNEKADNFIRFGLSQDLGHYVDLEPGAIKAEMKSDLVPVSRGADPFERMAEQALKADAQLEAGEITPIEHKLIIEQILQYFEANS